jgi:hypothetical protein
MNGLDPIIASSLASRLDSVLNAVSGGGVSANQSSGASQAAVSTAAPATPGTPASTAADGTPAATPPSSTLASLSSTALAVDAILRADSNPPGPVVSSTPLIATPPGPPSASLQTPTVLAQLAGSPNASVTTALLDQLSQQASSAIATQAPSAAVSAATGALAGSSALSASTTTADNALATSALAGVSQSGATDPLVVALASALQQNVDSSGLFYESHLAQWVGGTRSTADLQNEPQTQLANSTPSNPPTAAQTPAEAGTLASRVASSLATLLAAPVATPQNAAAPSAAQNANGTASNSASNAGNGANNGANPVNNAANALNPQTQTLVRQQLDMLANPQFRWSGQAWPGARMDWEVERRASDGSAADTSTTQTWRTRISIELPSLGRVDAELSLNSQQLSARIKADPSGASTLIRGGEDFRKRAAAAGLDLRAFQVNSSNATPDGASSGNAGDGSTVSADLLASLQALPRSAKS